MAMIGTVEAGVFSLNLVSVAFEQSATSTIVTGVTGKRIYVYAVKLVASANLDAKWRSGASNDLEGDQSYSATGGYVENVTPPAFLFKTAAGEGLDLVQTGTGTLAGRVSYWIG